MSDTIGFSMSNRSIHPLDRRPNCSLGLPRRWLKQEKIREMGPDFDYINADSGDMAGWKSAIDSGCKIGLFIHLCGILIVVWRCIVAS